MLLLPLGLLNGGVLFFTLFFMFISEREREKGRTQEIHMCFFFSSILLLPNTDRIKVEESKRKRKKLKIVYYLAAAPPKQKIQIKR